MKKTLFHLLFICCVFPLLISCDTTLTPESPLSSIPKIKSFSISPDSVQFDRIIDGFKDTTLTIELSVIIESTSDDFNTTYTILDKDGERITGGNLVLMGDAYISSARLDINTTSFLDLTVNVFALNNQGLGSTAEGYIDINGFSNNPPEIVNITSPGIIERPMSGEIPATFTATVTDEDGDDTIDRVFIRFIDQATGEVEGSPFLMSDDGTNLGDETAGDHTYTWSLPVTPTNNRPERNFNIEYFAIDQGGLVSDTVATTFSITSN